MSSPSFGMSTPPWYAHQEDGSEIYSYVDGQVLFMEDNHKCQMYAKDVDGNEFYPEADTVAGQLAQFSDGTYYYAQSATGTELYPVDRKGDQVPVLGYTHRRNKLEIYPRTHTGDIIFFKDEHGDEVYAKFWGGTDLYRTDEEFETDDLPRYARTRNGDEKYPIHVYKNTGTSEIVLNHTYALWGGQVYYPMDEYGNEYILDTMPVGYPITNNNLVIVPRRGQAPVWYDATVTEDDFTALIPRKPSKDYLTRVASKRKSRSVLLPYPRMALEKPTSIPTRVAKPAKSAHSYVWYILGLLIVWMGMGIFVSFQTGYTTRRGKSHDMRERHVSQE